MRCARCDREFAPKNSRGRFCSSKCRSAARQGRRDADLALALEGLSRAAARLEWTQKVRAPALSRRQMDHRDQGMQEPLAAAVRLLSKTAEG
jgi:ribosomal protein L24E